MRAYVGTSQSDSLETAIAEATAGLKTADLLLLLSPYRKIAEAAELLSNKYPGVPMMGTAGSTIAKKTISDSQIVVIGFAGVTVSMGLMEHTNSTPVTGIGAFEEAIEEVNPNPDNTICLEFVSSHEEKVLSTMNAVLREHELSMLGASCYGVPLGEKPLVVYNGKVYNRSCVYAIIRNNAGKIHLHRENIYKRMNKRAHFATLVDPGTKALFQLDGRSALEVYEEDTGIEPEYIVANTSRNPLGRALGGDTCIIQTKSVDMNGVMFNGKAIHDNDSIYVMELDDFRSIHQKTCDDIVLAASRVSFLLCFDSINRLKLFTEENYIEEYVTSLSDLGHQVSLLGDAQQYCGQQMNQTLVCAAFE